MLESVFMGRDSELLPQLFQQYAPKATIIRDVTASSRRMWKGSKLIGVRFYDIDPSVCPDVVCAWDNIPDVDNSVDVIVFDPPHLPNHAASLHSAQGGAKSMISYGLSRSSSNDEISELFPSFLVEAKRVLNDDGWIFAKIKDYTHNHQYRFNYGTFISKCFELKLVPYDVIVKRDPCGGNLKSGRWKRHFHVRNVHCFWVIVRKTKRRESEK